MSKKLGTAGEFFELIHFKEVLTIACSHVIVYGKFNLFDMMKTVIVHLFIGYILTFVACFASGLMGPVSAGGGYAN